MKLEKISSYVLYGLSAVIVLSFLAFFTFGYDNMEGDRNAPVLTGYLLVLQYLLAIGGFVLLAWSVFDSARKSRGTDELQQTGVPGSKVMLFTVAVTIISLAVGAIFGIGEEDFTTTSGATTPGYMVTVVDAFIWSIYILAVVSVLAVIVSATGIFSRKK